MSDETKAVFLSYASQDAQAKIAAADRDREDQQAHEMGMAGHDAVLADDMRDRGWQHAV